MTRALHLSRLLSPLWLVAILLLPGIPWSAYCKTIETYALYDINGNQHADLHKTSSLLEEHPLIDGHNDLMIFLRFAYRNKLYGAFKEKFEAGGLEMHVDIPRLEKGKVGGAFWSAFVPCPKNVTDFTDLAYAPVVRATLEQLDLFHRLSAQYPKLFTPASNSTAALEAFEKGNLISPVGIEGLHQIGNSLSTLRLYHRLGVRYATLTWNCHNKYADAALISENDETIISRPLWKGVSPAGEQLILEMNRVGMLVDLSHVSQNTMRDVLGVSGKSWRGSKAPIIFSHSSAFAICPHPRNVPDDVLKAVKSTNSLVMVNFSPDFISCTASNSTSGLPEFYPPNATLNQVVRHIKHIGELIGYDHVGIGTDYDGIERTPRGLEDVSKFPTLVKELLKQGVSEQNVVKLVGGNLLRVWKKADEIALELQKSMHPIEDDIIPW